MRLYDLDSNRKNKLPNNLGSVTIQKKQGVFFEDYIFVGF